MRAFTPPDEGSTDVSTRESGEEGAQRPHDGGVNHPEHPQSDNQSLSSFPLLSTNAKEGLITEPRLYPPQASVHYTQPGNIPQLQVAAPRAQGGHTPEPQDARRETGEQNRVVLLNQTQQPLQLNQSSSQPRGQTQHLDLYRRQHGEELQQLESHLKYLEEQHKQLEDRIQGRQHVDNMDVPSDENEEDRPRSVRFAAQIAQDMEEQYQKKKGSQESPTSVAQFDDQAQDNSNNSSSVLSPKALFPGQPRSILRRKEGTMPLDSTGRYPSSYRGRSHVPVFKDGHGREVSPIRSPGRNRALKGGAYQMPPEEASIPDNPDERDTAVLFDSEADVDLELMRREVCFDLRLYEHFGVWCNAYNRFLYFACSV